MSGGIDIRARYTVVCDRCHVRAEPDDEYHRFVDAANARDRVAKFDGWLLRWPGGVPYLLCPECAAVDE
jgi:hypothetical protein